MTGTRSQDAADLQDVTQHPVFNGWGGQQIWHQALQLTSPLKTTNTQVNWWDGPVASALPVDLRAKPKKTCLSAHLTGFPHEYPSAGIYQEQFFRETDLAVF